MSKMERAMEHFAAAGPAARERFSAAVRALLGGGQPGSVLDAEHAALLTQAERDKLREVELTLQADAGLRRPPVVQARSIDGALYDVTYSDNRCLDSAVRYSYLESAAQQGYVVEVYDRHGHLEHTISPTVK